MSLRQREPAAEDRAENMRKRWGIRPARSSLGFTRGTAIYHGIITESIADSRSLFFSLSAIHSRSFSHFFFLFLSFSVDPMPELVLIPARRTCGPFPILNGERDGPFCRR